MKARKVMTINTDPDSKGRKRFFVLILLICLLSFSQPLSTGSGEAFAADEVLKTQKVRVGEKAPMTEILKKEHDAGMAIALILYPNPMQCNRCDQLMMLLDSEAPVYSKDVAFITAGATDLLGAIDEEALQLKRLYGFVTIGEPWTFFIDKEGVLRKILIGAYTKDELAEVLLKDLGVENKSGGKK